MILKDVRGNEFDFSKFIDENSCVVFIYPKMGASGKFLSENLKDKKGLTGCTLQAKSYGENLKEFQNLGFKVVAIGSQNPQNQANFKDDLGVDFLFLNDENFILKSALNLKTFDTLDGAKFYFRQTLVIKDGKILEFHEVDEPENDALKTLEICKNLQEGSVKF